MHAVRENGHAVTVSMDLRQKTTRMTKFEQSHRPVVTLFSEAGPPALVVQLSKNVRITTLVHLISLHGLTRHCLEMRKLVF
jgi:hypothetical protein